jgi:phage tail-like protein
MTGSHDGAAGMTRQATQTSSYLRYLPPVLWDVPAQPGDVTLGRLLLTFEKLLTGVPDDIVVRHNDHSHGAVSTEIDTLERIFDSWVTPEPFLKWLAECLALEVPTLRDDPLWNEYQRRIVIAKIASIYPLRGTKACLSRYLELFAARRARVAIDDGARLLALTPGSEAVARVVPLVTQGPVLTGERIVTNGLLRPWCLAATSDGLMVGDIAMPDSLLLPFKSSVWQLTASGGYRTSGSPPSLGPLAPTTLSLNRVVAVAVRPPKPGIPETLYVLDNNGRLFALARPFEQATVLTTGAAGITDAPVAMAFDARTGELLVLARGSGPGSANPHKILTVRLDPLTVTARTDLRTVREPLALAVDPDGTLLVGDGGEQRPTTPEQLAGNIVSIDRTTTPWKESALLPSDNPLIAPTALARTRDGVLYVLDAGLKPFAPSTTFPFISAVAEPARVFRISGGRSASATRITQPGQFVYPTGMVATGGRLMVCDPGQPPNGWSLANADLKRSRALPFQFDVVVHFAADLLPKNDAARRPVVRKVLSNVRAIVDRERPAHVRCNVISGS